MRLHGVKAQAYTLCFYYYGTGLRGFTALISCNELDGDYGITQIDCLAVNALALTDAYGVSIGTLGQTSWCTALFALFLFYSTS